MTGNELRRRLIELGLNYRQAADLLALSYSGLHHQMRGERPVSRQTERLLEEIEARPAKPSRRAPPV